MATFFYFFCSTVVLSAIFLTPTTVHGMVPENHVPFFIFGDSLLDAGNNQYINGSSAMPTSSLPYGETFFGRPTGRVCDGRIVPDFIAEYANLPLIKPYLEPGFNNYTNGANFASAGAGVLPETNPQLIYLKLQLSYFETASKKLREQIGEEEGKKLISKAVYLFSMGGNDYMSLSSRPSETLTSAYRNMYMRMILGNYTTVIKEIYKLGGRKFAFQNVGPLGCMPSSKAQKLNTMASSSTVNTTEDCIKQPQMLAKIHNMALSKLLKRLEKTLPGFKYSLFDYYFNVAERTLYCSHYGFENGKSACCGSGPYNGNFACGGGRNGGNFTLCSNPSKYVWFDAGHPTEHTNKQLSDLFWAGPKNITGPYNLKMLFNML